LLHLAVRDLGPRLLHPPADDLTGDSGRDLPVVARLAKVWGIHSHPAGGRVVWCTLQIVQRR
jgi:hypothetical protein